MRPWDRILAPCAWAALHQIGRGPVGDRDLVCSIGARQMLAEGLATRTDKVCTITPLGAEVAAKYKPSSVGRITTEYLRTT